jgi:hypothetical protein
MPTVATAIAFDDMMELLWTGNEYVSTGNSNVMGSKTLTGVFVA